MEQRIEPQLERGHWSNHFEYILSMIGYAVGLGNAWRFPYIAYQNGGGAFLIPYFIMIVFLGSATVFMEVSMGQFCGQSSPQAFHCAPLLRGIGIAVVFAAGYIGIYYNVVIAYAIHYLVLSFRTPLPWTSCAHKTSSPYCVETRKQLNASFNDTCGNTACKPISASENYFENVVLELSSGIEETGKVKDDLLVALFISWVIICICTIKGVSSVGKAVYFTALFPYVVLTILLIGSLQQDGATDGIYFLFKPEWSTLGTAKVWLEAANQILLSLSLCIGGLITLSSYNPFHNNCLKDTMIIVLVNTGTSLYAGITIFATLGFMAKKLNVDIKDVVAGGPGLAFVVYPEAAAQFDNPQIFAVLFFFMLITLGFDTMFAIVETIVATVVDSAPHIFLKHKKEVVVATCFILFLLGINIVTQGGFYWLLLLDTYAGGYVLLWSGVFEVITVAHVYGIKNFEQDIEMMLGKKPPAIFGFVLYYITPVIFTVLAVSSVIEYQVLSYNGKPLKSWADAVGWLLISSMILIVFVVAIIEIRSKEGTLVERIKASLKPGKSWRPYRDIYCTGRYELNIISKTYISTRPPNTLLDGTGSNVEKQFSEGAPVAIQLEIEKGQDQIQQPSTFTDTHSVSKSVPKTFQETPYEDAPVAIQLEIEKGQDQIQQPSTFTDTHSVSKSVPKTFQETPYEDAPVAIQLEIEKGQGQIQQPSTFTDTPSVSKSIPKIFQETLYEDAPVAIQLEIEKGQDQIQQPSTFTDTHSVSKSVPKTFQETPYEDAPVAIQLEIEKGQDQIQQPSTFTDTPSVSKSIPKIFQETLYEDAPVAIQLEIEKGQDQIQQPSTFTDTPSVSKSIPKIFQETPYEDALDQIEEDATNHI